MIVFAPLLILYLGAAGAVVWVAVIDAWAPDGPEPHREIGWCLRQHLEAAGWYHRPIARAEIPAWLTEQWAVEAVGAWLTGIFAPPRQIARPKLAAWAAAITWVDPPPPAALVDTAELVAVG